MFGRLCDSDKCTSLLCQDKNYCHSKFYCTGPIVEPSLVTQLCLELGRKYLKKDESQSAIEFLFINLAHNTLSLSLTHTHTHTLSLTPLICDTHTHSLSLTHRICDTYSLFHPITGSVTHSPSFTHSPLTLSLC